MASQNKKLRRKNKGMLILRLLGIILFVIILSRVDLKETWSFIKSVDPFYFILALLSQLALLLIKAYRWHLLNNPEISKGNAIQSMGEFFESYAIGVVTPGRLGEMVKAGYQDEKSKRWGTIVRILSERGIDVGVFLAIAGAALIWGQLIAALQIYGLLIFITGLLIIAFSILIIGNAKAKKLLSHINKNLGHAYYFHSSRRIASIGLLSLASNAFAFLSIWFLALGLALNMGFLTVSGGVAVAGIFNMLPVTVMGLGTRELIFIQLFHAFPQTQILALSGLVLIVAQWGGGLMAFILGQLLLGVKRKS